MPSPDATVRAGASLDDRVSVLLPLPLAGPFDYSVDTDRSLADGDFVCVPLGPREVAGVVWGQSDGDVPVAKLKAVVDRLAVPPLPDVLRRFIDWVAAYTLAPQGSVLRMAMSVPAALEPPPPRRAYVAAAAPPPLRLTPARRRVLALLADGPPRDAAELAREAGVTAGVVRGLVNARALDVVTLPPAQPFAPPDLGRAGPALSADQAAAAAVLVARLRDGAFAVTLLEGVTGAGKTEVYFEAVAAALAAGRQVLVLLPEIALTPQWFTRFAARFGVVPAVWHSDIGQTRRRVTWRGVAEGSARIVVGARSALFLPYSELGLIVVDEEHEAAFKQEDGVTYHARDMAVVRARLGDFPIVLVSATPSLETLVNVERGRYGHVRLPDRFATASMPTLETVDLRQAPPPSGRFLSPVLRQALQDTLARDEQALLFLNRRGYAPLTLCRACGHRIDCPHCTAWLVEHRFRGRLQCHHCGYTVTAPAACPACGAVGELVACGPGVERVAEELQEVTPAARVQVMTSDTVRGPDAATALVAAVEAREVDVLIGTQMVAKGHHFPWLTLVGVVDADLGLAGGDLRAAERTYQLLYQVAGRAGRAERPGRVILQTHAPDHPVMQALATGDREGFLQLETAGRRAGGWPPFGRLAAIILSGREAAAVDAAGRLLARTAPSSADVGVLGPAPAPLAVLRGRHRRRLLVKTGRGVAIQRVLHGWLDPLRLPSGVHLAVDVDPYSFL